MQQKIIQGIEFGWLEKANALRIAIERDLVPAWASTPGELGRWFFYFLVEQCRYNASTNRLSIRFFGRQSGFLDASCVSGQECIEVFRSRGLADNPECLQVQE